MLRKLLDDVKNLPNLKKQKKIEHWYPIANFTHYIRNKQIADEKLALASPDPEAMRARNKQHHERIIHLQEASPPPRQKPRRPPKFKYTEELDRVKLYISVSKNGTIRAKITQPMLYLHDNYWSRGQCPPLNEYIVCLRHAGYPDASLERYMKVHMEREKLKPEMEEFIDRVFGSSRKLRNT